jgi:hypothetical protein
MTRLSASARAEADLAALREAADRAGLALACLFSSAAEFEAAIVRVRRPLAVPGRSRLLRRTALLTVLAAAFLML